ncbi:MAG: hrpB [Acidobacteria bacterium]|nr:hrpB [Acidobacteriota bacterium]
MFPHPVDRHLDAITDAVRRHRAAVVVAPPGSGKTTRIPPVLAAAFGRTILLQPRRVAARALARRIAAERNWSLGGEIGWQIRFERRFSRDTQLLVATEGVLTARLQSDPLLSDFSVVILDEFHERSIHADVALALARQAALSRDDLFLVVMSATIDARSVSRFLGDAPVLDIDARRHPVEVRYRPGLSMSEAVRESLPSAKGDVLCFLPGAREIERAQRELGGVDALRDVIVLPLHGSLDVDAQERALLPAAMRKVILATNVAETSLTVEGVTDVIDSGQQKVLRFDPSTAVDHLELERIALDSAEQRAGRAGRTAPGRATRLWDAREILRPHREPEVRRVDLAATVLDVIAWGGDPRTFEWFDPPPADRIDAALRLLARLGAIEGRRLTPLGEQLRAFPLHPRLARAAIAAHGADEALDLAVRLGGGQPQEARALANIARRLLGTAYRRHIDDAALRRALLAGYPDRVARRRERGAPEVLLATGTGAKLAREIDDGASEFVVVLEVVGELVRQALPVEREWLAPTRREVVHLMEDGRVRAVERVWYDELLLHEQQVPPDPVEAARLLARSLAIDVELQRRIAFARLDVDWDALRDLAASGRTRAGEIDLAAHLPFDVRRRLNELAPESFPLPSGRSARLEYRDDGSILASAKLQELFGLAETPRIGPDRVPITFALLAPNGRPVQVTRDLRSFWNNTYPEVRKELRGRYPRHPWPDDPWTATPTHRTTRRK